MLDVHHTPPAYKLLGKEPLHLIPPLCSGRGDSRKCHPKGQYTKGAMEIDRGAWTWITLLETVFSLRTLKLIWRVVWWIVTLLWTILFWLFMGFQVLLALVLGFCGVKTYFSE
jgi:hypothetical protein